MNIDGFEDFLYRAETGEQVRIEAEEGALCIRCRRDGRRCSEVATLELGRNMPLKMDFGLPEGKLLYYLAPIIQE